MPDARLVLLSSLIALSVPVLQAADAPTPPMTAAATTESRSPRWQQIDPLLEQSIAALVAGDETKAASFRQQALDLAGFLGADHVPPEDVLEARAKRIVKINQLDAAILDYREALQGSGRTDLRLTLAQLLIVRDRAEEAIQPLTEISSIAAEYGAAQLLLGKMYLARYEQTKSIDELADATLALNPPTRTARNVLTPEGEAALTALGASLKKLSPEQYTALVAARKNHRLTRARALIQDNRGFDALPLLNDLLALDPSYASAYELRTRVSDYETVRNRTDLQIAAELRTSAPEIPAQGDALTVALAQASLHIHQRPYEVGPYLERAKVRMTSGSYKPEMGTACLQDAQFARDLDPDDPMVLSTLSEAFSFQKLTITLDPANGNGFKERDAAQAAAIYQADLALALAPTQIGLLVWRAAMERKEGQGNSDQTAARAMVFLNRAIQASPTNRGALFARAQAARHLEDYTLAIDDCRTLIRLYPAVPVYSYNLGWILMEAEKFRASAKAFAASIGGEDVPDDAYSLQVLALAFAGDLKSEVLAAAIPEHSISTSGAGIAEWNIGHNKRRLTPLVERVAARLKKAEL